MRIYFFLFLTILSFSCHQKDLNEEFIDSDLELETPWINEPSTPKSLSTTSPAKEKNTLKLIKKGNVSFKTESITSTKRLLDSLVNQYDAYISNQENKNNSYRKQFDISIRIKSSQFDLILANLSSKISEFDKQSNTVKDVTADYIDLVSRSKSKISLEARYIKLLGRANKVEDILRIEKQIGEIREEIETMQGKIKYYNDQVSYSTLNISFYETYEIKKEEPTFLTELKDSFSKGWENVAIVFLGLIYIWPLIVLIILLFFGLSIIKVKSLNN